MSYDDAYSNLRVGLFAIGHEAYWSQFEGLEQRLQGVCRPGRGTASAVLASRSSTWV